MGLLQAYKEKKLAEKLVKEATYKLFEEIGLDPKYLSFYVKLVERGEPAGIIPEKRTIYISKYPIRKFISKQKYIEDLYKALKEEKKRIEKLYEGVVSERMEILKKRQIERLEHEYKARIEVEKKKLESYKRMIEGIIVGEIAHGERYILHPEKTKMERYDPKRRRIEEAIATCIKLVTTTRNKEEIINTIKGLPSETLYSLYESLGSIGEFIDETGKYMRRTFSISSKKEVEMGKMIRRSNKGYIDGSLAALALIGMEKEDRKRYLNRLLESKVEESSKIIEDLKEKAIEENPEIKHYFYPKYLSKEDNKTSTNTFKKLKDLLLISLLGIGLFLLPIFLTHNATSYIAQTEPIRSFFTFIIALLLSSIVLLSLKIYSDYKS